MTFFLLSGGNQVANATGDHDTGKYVKAKLGHYKCYPHKWYFVITGVHKDKVPQHITVTWANGETEEVTLGGTVHGDDAYYFTRAHLDSKVTAAKAKIHDHKWKGKFKLIAGPCKPEPTPTEPTPTEPTPTEPTPTEPTPTEPTPTEPTPTEPTPTEPAPTVTETYPPAPAPTVTETHSPAPVPTSVPAGTDGGSSGGTAGVLGALLVAIGAALGVGVAARRRFLHES